jgi:hypothetical protein
MGDKEPTLLPEILSQTSQFNGLTALARGMLIKIALRPVTWMKIAGSTPLQR